MYLPTALNNSMVYSLVSKEGLTNERQKSYLMYDVDWRLWTVVMVMIQTNKARALVFHVRWLQSPDTQAWQNDYLQGTGCEMYTETLSTSFTGMSFAQASE